MKFKNKLSELSKMPYFDYVTVGNLLGIFGTNLAIYLSRNVKTGKFVRLKRGLYVTNDYYEKETQNQAYLEFLANKIYSPSYLSLEYMLQKYAVISESVFSLTSMTLKKPELFVNKTGSYQYTNIKDDLFSGFEIIKKGRYQVLEATLAKALYDYLYFAIKPWNNVTEDLFYNLRLNLDDLKNSDIQEFKNYVNNFGGVKMKRIEKIICNQ